MTTHLNELIDTSAPAPTNTHTVDFGGTPLLVGYEYDEDVLPQYGCTDVCIGGVWMMAESVLLERVVRAIGWQITADKQAECAEAVADAAIERAEFAEAA